MMDWNTLLPTTPAQYLPVMAGQPQDLPLFAALGSGIETLVFTGPEAAKFLQGQVTCDLGEITAGNVRLGAHCNPKGRAQATFLAFSQAFADPLAAPADASTPSDQQTITLLLPAGMAEHTEAQLKKFAMFSKVTLQRPEGPDAMRAAIVGGTEALDWLHQHGVNPGTLMQLCRHGAAVHIAALDAEQRLFLVLATANALKALLDQLPPHAVIAQQPGWWQCLTALGQAHVTATTQEEFIPQELNYDLNQGVSFKKGCYKGQEIIARLHFKGTPKFRTLRFGCQSAMPLQAGSHVNDKNGARLGQIAQVARTGEQSYELLLVTKPDAIASGESVITDTGITLQLTRLPLPYALP